MGTVGIKMGPVPKFDYILKEILQPHVGFRLSVFSLLYGANLKKFKLVDL